MKLALRIARRYLFSKKKTNIINVLSLLSVIGVLLSTGALVVVLSVFNGFEEQILNAYNPLSPDIRITSTEGKRFIPDSLLLSKVKETEGVELVVPIIRERGVLQFKEHIALATIIGLPDEAMPIYSLDTLMQSGSFYTHYQGQEFVVLGYPLAAQLHASLFAIEPISIYAAKRGKKAAIQFSNAFNKALIRPSGVYDGDPKFTQEHVFVSYDFARNLFAMGNSISAWEIKTVAGASASDVREQLKELLGAKFEVKERYQLNETLFRMLKIEKLFVFATLVIILLIAAFNVVGSLSMIIIDKKEDIAVLKSMGATTVLIKHIFVAESLMISMFGAVAGLFLGLFVSWGQLYFGWVKMQMSYGAIPFPVLIQWQDIVTVILVVLLMGFLIALFTVRSIPKELKIADIH